MCGIAGILDVVGRRSPAELVHSLSLMTDALAHRGPDDAGAFQDVAGGVVLGHRRLAVVDLSPAGHQPMVTQDGRLVLVFNGMIYNYGELRRRLESRGVRFRGRSDTEVLLEACAAWGVEEALRLLNGMFALALWDRHQRVLVLARDRLGEKPLLWYEAGGCLAFASELGALLALPGAPRRPDAQVLADVLRWSFVPGDASAVAGVRRLLPGHVLRLDAHGRTSVRPYWSLEAVARSGRAASLEEPDAELVDRTEALLLDSVRLRLQADVPVGTFLSGGVDSSLVTALATRSSSSQVRTFTVGMAGGGDLDESGPAEAVARHLGTDHTTVVLTPRDVMAAVEDVATVYDEPFADPSALPVLMLARATREHVTVALSGDGGDELFGGYNRYAAAQALLDRARSVPQPARRAAAAALLRVPHRTWSGAAHVLGRVPALAGVPEIGSKVHRAAEVLGSPDLGTAWVRLATVWQRPPVRGAVLPRPRPPGDELVDLLLRDQLLGLPDDMLTKVDRATMAVALEARVPLLDHRLVEWSWRLPSRAKVRDGRGKWVLRQVLDRHVPAALVDRPKTGFDPPLGAWLRGPLRLWAEERLSLSALASTEVLDAAPVRRAWHEHLAGRADHTYRLWSVLVLQSWLQRLDGRGTPG